MIQGIDHPQRQHQQLEQILVDFHPELLLLHNHPELLPLLQQEANPELLEGLPQFKAHLQCHRQQMPWHLQHQHHRVELMRLLPVEHQLIKQNHRMLNQHIRGTIRQLKLAPVEEWQMHRLGKPISQHKQN
jgi:hypothetical protein